MQVAAITRRIEIDMGHRVPWHTSKCRHLHGHRYVFEVTLQGPIREHAGESDEGMVQDFGDVKELLTLYIHDPYDHGLMLYEKDPIVPVIRELPDQKIILVPFVPTAENIAMHTYTTLSDRLGNSAIEIASVLVRETPNCSARYPGTGEY